MYVPGTFLESGNTVMNKTGKAHTFKEISFQLGERDSKKYKQIDQITSDNGKLWILKK